MTAVSPLWLLAGVMGVLGLAVGSFLNVVIYRVPASESIVSPGSHCPNCDVPIRGRHNVPVVSWVALRGRCASCRVAISARYPLVEAGTALLFVAVTLRFGLSVALPAYLYLAAVGISLAMIDVDTHWLPDSIVLPSYVVTVVLLMPAAAVDGDWHHAWHGLAGMSTFLVMFGALAFTQEHGARLSDAKLAGLIGLYLGWLSWWALMVTAVVTILALGVGGVVLAARRPSPRTTVLPLGPFLICAAVVALFATTPVAQLYGSLVTT